MLQRILRHLTAQPARLAGLIFFIGLVPGCDRAELGPTVPPGPAISREEFEAELTSSSVVLVKFGASWCGPCRKMDAELDRLRADGFAAKILEVDIDTNPKLAREYRISSIPKTILFRDGKQSQSHVGFFSADEIRAWVNEQ